MSQWGERVLNRFLRKKNTRFRDLNTSSGAADQRKAEILEGAA